MRRSCRVRIAGLSMLEMLVVMALIATLLGMLFPVLSEAREKARSTVCLSNLRQIGAAMAMYAQDYDGLYPYGADAADKYSLVWGVDPTADPILREMPLLHVVLYPYSKGKDVWRCPSDTGFDYLDDHIGPNGPLPLKARPTAFEAFGSSYYYRTEIAFRHKLFGTDGVRNGETVGCGEIAVLWEMSGSWHGGPKYFDGQFNALMGDGHVKHLDRYQLSEAWAISLAQSN